MRGKPGQIKVEGDEISGDGDNLNTLTILTGASVTFTASSHASTISFKINTRTLEIRDGIVTLIGVEGTTTWTTTTSS